MKRNERSHKIQYSCGSKKPQKLVNLLEYKPFCRSEGMKSFNCQELAILIEKPPRSQNMTSVNCEEAVHATERESAVPSQLERWYAATAVVSSFSFDPLGVPEVFQAKATE